MSDADEAGWPSPLDGDCFDLLQALDARRGLPVEYWRWARRAHGKRVCAHHQRLLGGLNGGDATVSFNADGVARMMTL